MSSVSGSSADTPARIFALASIAVGIWIVAYWLYPWGGASPKITFAETAQQPVEAPPPEPIDERPTEPPRIVKPTPPPKRLEPPTFRQYVVQEGELLEDIARQEYGDRALASVIMEANPFLDPRRLVPGKTKINLPLNPQNITGRVVDADGAAEPVESYVPSPPKPEVRTHLIAKRDTLWAIAKTYYGKGHLWTKLYEANRDIIDDPDNPPIGEEIRVPYIDVQ